jgi:glutathione synthase/RimK-type ligase-like ATP-grasp enzyme
MAALVRLQLVLGLDYGGFDFGVRKDGSVLLFEANATMTIVTPGPDKQWDYRRAAIDRALAAARRMLLDRLNKAQHG